MTEPLSMSTVVEGVAQEFGLSQAQIMSRSRFVRIALPRQVAYYVAHVNGRFSLSQVAAYMGRDRVSVRFGIEMVAQRCQRDQLFANRVARCETRALVQAFASPIGTRAPAGAEDDIQSALALDPVQLGRDLVASARRIVEIHRTAED